MKLEIYDKCKDEGIYRIGLKDNYYTNYISLGIVDESGNMIRGGYLLKIDKRTGAITRESNVCTGYGFKLDDNGKILLD